MIPRQKWIDHIFNFNIDVGWGQNIITRIGDVGIRCEYHCKGLSEEELSKRINQKWSIKEHIGHLIDIDALHYKRLHEFKHKKNELTAADMSNQKTEKEKYYLKSLAYLINELIKERKKLIHLYQSLDESSLTHKAMHPRLNQLMRPVDIIYFVGEHDDHHITSIIEIKKEIKY